MIIILQSISVAEYYIVSTDKLMCSIFLGSVYARCYIFHNEQNYTNKTLLGI